MKKFRFYHVIIGVLLLGLGYIYYGVSVLGNKGTRADHWAAWLAGIGFLLSLNLGNQLYDLKKYGPQKGKLRRIFTVPGGIMIACLLFSSLYLAIATPVEAIRKGPHMPGVSVILVVNTIMILYLLLCVFFFWGRLRVNAENTVILKNGKILKEGENFFVWPFFFCPRPEIIGKTWCPEAFSLRRQTKEGSVYTLVIAPGVVVEPKGEQLRLPFDTFKAQVVEWLKKESATTIPEGVINQGAAVDAAVAIDARAEIGGFLLNFRGNKSVINVSFPVSFPV